MASRSELNLTNKAQLRARLAIRFSSILEMPEEEAARLARILESDPVFEKLFRPRDPAFKVISRKRFPGTRFTSSFYDYNEETVPESPGGPGMEEFLSSRKGLVDKIRAMGVGNFEKYFLYEDGTMTAEDISREANLPAETVAEIRKAMDEVMMHPDFFRVRTRPPEASPEIRLNVTRLAEYVPNPGGGLDISFLSPGMARGLYGIDYDKLKKLKSSGSLDPKEKKSIQETIRFLEMLNARKNLIYRILHLLPLWQKDFFESCDWDRLVPLTQKSAAGSLGVTPAAICRAIQDRSVILPAREETSISDLFPSRKDILKRKMGPVFRENPGKSDRVIQKIVEESFRVRLSRRSINVYRSELKTTA